MSYEPGTHIIASMQAADNTLLNTCDAFRGQLDSLINTHSLKKLGEVYHNFEPAGYTAVICLSESHISIHTWPEHGLINIDIYLSNFQRNNDGTVDAIFRDIRQFFNASIVSQQLIRR